MSLDEVMADVFGQLTGPLSREERAEVAEILGQYHAERIKKMAQRWLGRAARTRKQECIDQMVDMLGKPQELQRLADSLTPFERYGFWTLATRGGSLPCMELAACLLASGHEYKDVGNYYSYYAYGFASYEFFRTVSSLSDSGLLIDTVMDGWNNTLDPTPFSRTTAVIGVTTYARLLPYVQPQAPRPLDLPALSGNLSGDFRRPAQAAMPVVAAVEAVRAAGEISLTARGGIPKPFVNRVAKRLSLPAPAEGDPFPDPMGFYLQLLLAARFVEHPDLDRRTTLAADLNQLLALPYEVQAAQWLNGYRVLKNWAEPLPHHVHFYVEDLSRTTILNAFRNLVVTALSALPDPEAWYSAAAFSDALFARAGTRMALRYLHSFVPDYRAKPAQVEEQREAHRKKQQGEWRAAEQPVIASMLRGPLYQLGLTEVTLAGPEDFAFRLTDLGRAVLYGTPMPGAGTDSQPPAEAWVVQPNLEVIAYLDRAQPQQLGFLGKIAERKSSTGPVTMYTITRESIYAALEAGLTAEDLVLGLQQSSAKEVPDTVVRSIREWAARRERIGLYPAASLLQYADASARDAALARLSPPAQPVGDRFILLPDGNLHGVVGRKEIPRIDYAGAPFRCVEVAEDGTLRIDPLRADLLVASELDAFADPVPDAPGTWKLSRESVQRAVTAGHTADGIIKALRTRATAEVPAILAVGVGRWGRRLGHPAPASLETVLVLELPSEEVAGAVASSHRFKPLLRSRLGPRAFSVAIENRTALDELLEEYGLAASVTETKPEARFAPNPSARRSPAR